MSSYKTQVELNGADDAQLLSEKLRTHAHGTDNFKVTVHKSDEDTQLTTEDLMVAVDSWFKAAPISDGLIFFSGHASNTEYGLHLAGFDTDGHFDAGFSFDTLLHRVNQEQFESLTIILDCCRAGAAADVSLDTRFDALLLRKNVAILASSREQEDSWGGDPTSQFTTQLLGALDATVIQNLGRPITVFDLFYEVREALIRVGHPQTQIPVLKAHISSDVIVRDIR